MIILSSRRFKFQGLTIDELKALALDEVLPLLPAKRRRSLSRAEFWTPKRKKLLEEIREAAELLQKGDKKVIRTHIRDFPIIPEMLGLTIAVYNGKEFIEVVIQPEMLGMVLGDLSPTTKIVRHGAPGMGATRSSLYVPLK